jgi:hypothetical protein
MNAFSTFIDNAMASHLLRHTGHTPNDNYTVALFIGPPGKTGISPAIEVSGTGYIRKTVSNDSANWPQCSVVGEPTKTNANAIVFPKATAAWGVVSHWGIFDSSSNFIVGGPLANPHTVANGDTPKISAGDISITISNATSGGLTALGKRKVLDLLFSKTTFATPEKVYTGFGTEITGETITEWTDAGNATRKDTTFGLPTAGVTLNSAITNNVSVATAATLRAFGIWDQSTSGNLLIVGPLSSSLDVAYGDSAGFNDAALSFTLQ